MRAAVIRRSPSHDPRPRGKSSPHRQAQTQPALSQPLPLRFAGGEELDTLEQITNIFAVGRIQNLRQKTLQRRAQALRRRDTEAEARLWNVLRAGQLGGWIWKRQVPFGPYILDFLCRDARLVVELDGGHHADQTPYDARRTRRLERAGLQVLRFWNAAVLTNRDGVCQAILNACPPSPLPPRSGEGEDQGEGRCVRR